MPNNNPFLAIFLHQLAESFKAEIETREYWEWKWMPAVWKLLHRKRLFYGPSTDTDCLLKYATQVPVFTIPETPELPPPFLGANKWVPEILCILRSSPLKAGLVEKAAIRDSPSLALQRAGNPLVLSTERGPFVSKVLKREEVGKWLCLQTATISFMCVGGGKGKLARDGLKD